MSHAWQQRLTDLRKPLGHGSALVTNLHHTSQTRMGRGSFMNWNKSTRLCGITFVLATGMLLGFSVSPSRGVAEDRFLLVPEEGGTKDLETGLVWGFPLGPTGTYLHYIVFHDGGGTSYTWLGAMNLSLNCNNDGTGFCDYPEFSNAYWGVNHNDWRIPTRDELVQAAQAGIIDHLDYSPLDGFQAWWFNPYFPDDPLPTGGNYPVWSSTGLKQRSVDSAYIVNLFNGNTSLVGKGSIVHAIAVRGVAAPSSDDGKGGGKGKP